MPRRSKPPSRTWRSFLDNHVRDLVSMDFFTVQRRELLDRAILLNERHLRRLLRTYVTDYYHCSRTHLSLDKDSPDPRAVQPATMGKVVEPPLVGGLHHRYTRRAA
jgi:hypothetical protein